MGFISQHKFIDDDDFLFLTPGIRNVSNIVSNQIYNTPLHAFKNGSDIIIVGSGIYDHLEPQKELLNYKNNFYKLFC